MEKTKGPWPLSQSGQSCDLTGFPDTILKTSPIICSPSESLCDTIARSLPFFILGSSHSFILVLQPQLLVPVLSSLYAFAYVIPLSGYFLCPSPSLAHCQIPFPLGNHPRNLHLRGTSSFFSLVYLPGAVTISHLPCVMPGT